MKTREELFIKHKTNVKFESGIYYPLIWKANFNAALEEHDKEILSTLKEKLKMYESKIETGMSLDSYTRFKGKVDMLNEIIGELEQQS